MTLPKPVRIVSIVLLAIVAGAQFVPVARTNPPATAPIQAPEEVGRILTRACADCHSNATRWPWYSRVAPTSWFVANHVHEARASLNFSYWELLDGKERRTKAKAVVDQLTAGEMPLRSYLIIHRDARLKPDEVRTLRDWFASAAANAGPSAPSASRGGALDEDDLLGR